MYGDFYIPLRKKVNSSTMTCHQLKNIPIFRDAKKWREKVHIRMSHPRALPRLATYECVMLDKLFNLSVLQFSHLWNGNGESTRLVQMLQGLNIIVCKALKESAMCLLTVWPWTCCLLSLSLFPQLQNAGGDTVLFVSSWCGTMFALALARDVGE